MQQVGLSNKGKSTQILEQKFGDKVDFNNHDFIKGGRHFTAYSLSTCNLQCEFISEALKTLENEKNLGSGI